jgi:dTDP-4-dehydrorhamnose 3,5-epimerase
MIKTKFKDVKIIKLKKNFDKRGFFSEIFNLKDKLNFKIKQINLSYSKKKNTFRGLHYQKGRNAQAKIIGVLKGEIIDYIICLKKKDKNFGKFVKVSIKENDMKFILIPKGYAHGFLTKKNNTLIIYYVDNFYDKKSEDGISALDDNLNLKLPKKLIMSKKDRNLKYLDKKI